MPEMLIAGQAMSGALDMLRPLREDYYRDYRRVVWLAQRPVESLRALAEDAAETLGLPLSVVPVGDAGLERELAALIGAAAPPATSRSRPLG